MDSAFSKTPRLQGQKLPLIIASPLILIGSIAIASMMQGLSAKFILLLIAMTGGWLMYSLVFGITLQRTLPLISMFFFKPNEYGFFFILLLFVLLGLVEYLRKEELKLVIPHPVASVLLLVFGIIAATKIRVPMGYTYFVSTVIVPITILTLFRNIRITREGLRLWMQMIVYVGAVVGLYGMIIAVLNPRERLGSFWVTAMTINGFYTVGFFFALTLALYESDRMMKIINGLAALLILMGMLYTYTRMAVLAVAFGIFLFMLKMKVMRYLGLGFMLLLPLLIPASMSSRIELGFGYDISLVIRALAWYLALGQIIKNPLFGMGFSVWSVWYGKTIPLRMLYAQHTHNLYLNLMMDMGIVGALCFLWLIYRTLRTFRLRYFKGRDDVLSFGLWASMLALLFSCITDIFIQQYSISILFWVSMGLMISLNHNKDSDEKL